MAIDAYVGLPRAGKSHGVVESVVLPALKQGRRIVHNMPLIDEGLREHVETGELVTIPKFTKEEVDAYAKSGELERHRIDHSKFLKWPEGLQKAQLFCDWFMKNHAGALLILDESWQYWPRGLSASSMPETQRKFFAMHGHLVGQTEDGRTTDVALIAQNLDQIAKFVVDLVEQTFHYVKHTAIGVTNRYRCDVYTGPVTGHKPSASRQTNSYQGKYKPEIFKCYTSHTMSKSGMAGMEDKSDKRGSILKSWKFRFACAAVLTLPFFLWFAVHSFFAVGQVKTKQPVASEGRPDERSEKGHSEPRTGDPVPSSSPSPQPSAPVIVESTRWRVSGLVDTAKGLFVVLDGPRHGRRLKASACLPDDSGAWSCVLDGELITEWSGARPDSPAGAFVAAAATPSAVRSVD